MRLDRPAVPLIRPQLGRGHVHQPSDVGDRQIRELGAARREPAVHRIETQQKSEPEFRRAPPPRQLVQLIPDQRPVPNELVLVQHTRHAASGSLTKRAAMPPHTPRIRINTGRARSPTSDDRRKIPHRSTGTTAELGELNRVYLVARVLPTRHVRACSEAAPASPAVAARRWRRQAPARAATVVRWARTAAAMTASHTGTAARAVRHRQGELNP
jgi:hypothetical protein